MPYRNAAARTGGQPEIERPPRRSTPLALGLRYLPHCIVTSGLLLATILVLAPVPRQMPASALPTAAVIVLFLAVWLTKLVSDNLAALILFVFAGVVAGLPLEIVFSGFQSPAVWLIFGGLIISAAIQNSDLGGLVADVVLRRMPTNYAGLTYALFLSGVALTPFLPTAVGRTILLVPVALGVADKAGLEKGSRGRDGLVLSAALGALLPAYAFLPSSAPNVILLGAAQSMYGIDITYFQFWLVNFPVLIASTIIVLPGLVVVLFREEARFSPDSESRAPMTSSQRKTAIILMITLVLWGTDSLHGLSPTWIALGCAAVFLLPAVGALKGVSVLQDRNIGTWLLIAAMISLGAMVKYTGLDGTFGRAVVDAVPLGRGEDFANLAAIVGIGAVTSLFMTTLAAPVVMTGLAPSLAAATGWPLETILFAQIPTWLFIILPHQTPILIIGMAMGGVSIGRAIRLLSCFAVIGLTVFLPLHFLWLRALGYLP